MTKEVRTAPKTIYFYNVSAIHKFRKAGNEWEARKTKIDSALEKVRELDLGDDETTTAIFEFRGAKMAMRIDRVGNNYYEGQIATIRDASFPQGLKDGELVELDFKGTNLFEPSHFVYFTDSKILVMEYNHYAPHHAGFAVYIEKLSKKYGLEPNNVTITYDIGRDTLPRFIKDGHPVNGLRLRIGVHAYTPRTETQLSRMIFDTMRNARESQVSEFDLVLNFEQATGSNQKQNIVDLFRNEGIDFHNFIVEMEGIANFDFLKDKIKARIDAKMTDLNRVDSEEMYKELRAQYTARYVPSR
ncbi:hypothetical protein [Deinococcus radiotolerans]|uniref:Uncharacterized protein n=1 Tax=Deinococcus radiotolerans TaxID=1309407 RepID=A0ABQ2FHQ1_9DEIO|nr:hypothetical protein [Deinococcus radiotolerans]GGK91616.1 hypothetical protein GCM10010844_07680 [Deinococcus radiotolerans]